ncbi:MAG: hypothetical protein IJ937_12265, partial [Treponema sp.]|nr:hypothetical protein [Treponema sp.]
KSLVRNFDSSFFGVQGATAATSSAVVVIGFNALARAMQAAYHTLIFFSYLFTTFGSFISM